METIEIKKDVFVEARCTKCKAFLNFTVINDESDISIFVEPHICEIEEEDNVTL